MNNENSPKKPYQIRIDGFRLDFSAQNNYNEEFIVRVSKE